MSARPIWIQLFVVSVRDHKNLKYPDLKGKFFQLIGSKGIQIIQAMWFPYSALFILMIKNLIMKSPSSKICLETVVKPMPYNWKAILTVFIMRIQILDTVFFRNYSCIW
ncbi:hypothetical protein BDC45DRAFT_541463 [Circinella umbellata]|nr:hypothetical protein BDC45DRAFT_541463 [Circinella umbellata]